MGEMEILSSYRRSGLPGGKSERRRGACRITSYLVSAQEAGLVQIADPETKQPAAWCSIAEFDYMHLRNSN
jgi:hypothetical protein